MLIDGIQYIYIKQDGEITNEPELIETEIDMGDGEIFREYKISNRVIDEIDNIPVQYIQDMNFANMADSLYISTEGIKLLAKETRGEFTKLYSLSLEELEKIAKEYNNNIQELNNLKKNYDITRYVTELGRLKQIKSRFPSKEEIEEINLKAHQQYKKEQEEFEGKYRGLVGFFRKIFTKHGTPMICEPPKYNYNSFKGYGGFESIEQLDKSINDLQEEYNEAKKQSSRIKELETLIEENKTASIATKILHFRRQVEKEKAREEKRRETSSTSVDFGGME